jgi:hypothetical protein
MFLTANVDNGTYPECFGVLKFTTIMDGIPLFVNRYRFAMGVILIVIGGVAAHRRLCCFFNRKPTVTRVFKIAAN